MILEFNNDSGLSVSEPDDFKAFKLRISGCAPGDKPVIEGVRYLPDEHAYIDQTQVIQAVGAHANADWHAGFMAMLEAASKYGWVEPGTQAIKAHIQWT